MKQSCHKMQFLLIPLLFVSSLFSQNSVEYDYGVRCIEYARFFLGLFIIIGAFGFFITTSARRSHWPLYIRRTFFGIFVFCNIFFHGIFNVLNMPFNKNAVTFLGKCIHKMHTIKLVSIG